MEKSMEVFVYLRDAGKELSLKLLDVEICVGWSKFWSVGWKDEIIAGRSLPCTQCCDNPQTKRFHHCRLGWDSLFSYLRNQANTFLLQERGCILSARPSRAFGICSDEENNSSSELQHKGEIHGIILSVCLQTHMLYWPGCHSYNFFLYFLDLFTNRFCDSWEMRSLKVHKKTNLSAFANERAT